MPAFDSDGTGIFEQSAAQSQSGISGSFVDATSSMEMIPNTTYYANSASLLIFTLPTLFNQNDLFTVIGKGSGGWVIAQKAGQAIHGATDTTRGTGGSLASQARYDAAFLRGLIQNTDLVITNKQGTLTSV